MGSWNEVDLQKVLLTNSENKNSNSYSLPYDSSRYNLCVDTWYLCTMASTVNGTQAMVQHFVW